MAPSGQTWLRRALPVVVVLFIITLLGYPFALLLGLPLALRDMRDLRKWERETIVAQPPLDLSSPSRLYFPRAPQEGVLVWQDAPLALAYSQEGEEVHLRETPPHLVVWAGRLEGPLDDSGRVFRLPEANADEAIDLAVYQAIYQGERLALGASVFPRELPDGQRLDFTFPAETGPILVGDAPLEEQDYAADGNRVVFARPPAFGSEVRRVSGDYAVLDAAEGTVVFAEPLAGEVRAASSVVRLAERLQGDVDGVNRLFRFERGNVFDNDPERAVFVDRVRLSDAPERPSERVDGVRQAFTFEGDRGIVTVDGVPLLEGQDYTRDGALVLFASPPPRNANLRQYADFFVSNAAEGELLLAEAPAPGAALWTSRYTVYAQPGCGRTVLECFYALPQHPAPFPHWIAQRLPAFFGKFPISDERHVLRASLYTALGTMSALALGGAVGIVLAVLFVLVRPLERALLPWVVASQTIPIIALVPVLLLILGNFGITIQTSILPTALIGAYLTFFPVAVGTVKGLRSVDPLALDLMTSYAASPLQVFMKVRFPAAVPFFFTSLKLGAAAALVGALVAETESNNRRGLGFAILGQVQSGNVADVWILLLVSGLLGILLISFVGLVQRMIAPWERA